MSQSGEILKGIPVTDNHVHFRPDGQMERAIRGFLRQGGVRLLLVHTPYEDLVASKVGGFEPGYERTLGLARRARQLGVEVLVALGPHPVELLALERNEGLEKAVEIMRSGLEVASHYVLERRAVAIGEVGRPHFPVDETIWDSSNELMAYSMQLAREADCAVILHTEEARPDLFRELATMAKAAGLSGDRVVKHHSDPLVLPRENHGIFPSVIAREDYVQVAARKGLRFLMETDYLDDPRRPGAVLGLNTVPRRCTRLLLDDIISKDDLHKIHADNVREVYGA
ncbi:MAG: TatD family hydrolase [Candidatus Thermoplasmatota archaeon]|nr:TatD family hydrolase [Candidatus Thermoplasmatota archaeon]